MRLPEPACMTWSVPTGLGVERDKDTLIEWQAGRCAGCGTVPDKLVEDHDHWTGRTRGFLCRPCNTAEGNSYRRAWVRWRSGWNPAALLGVDALYVNARGVTVIRKAPPRPLPAALPAE